MNSTNAEQIMRNIVASWFTSSPYGPDVTEGRHRSAFLRLDYFSWWHLAAVGTERVSLFTVNNSVDSSNFILGLHAEADCLFNNPSD